MLSSVILTKNEEGNIEAVIQSVNFSNEIIVVDDFSSDRTVEIARKIGAKVFQRKLNGDFSSQRNFGIQKTHGDWVLFIDADERVNDALKEEITRIIYGSDTDKSAYSVGREDIFFGKKLGYGEVGKIRFVRLAKKGTGKWKRRVHEYWNIKGNIGELKNPLRHYPHPNLNEFIADLNKNSTIHALANKEEGKNPSILKILFWPKLKFFSNYFIKGGLWDGDRGLVLALMMSFHSFLAWSKQWLLQKK